jgi:superfamily I DNA and/or RNA helicase
VLSPYNQQVNNINNQLKRFKESSCLKRCKSLGRRAENELRWLHSVDSFQGNEADVVIISLVRNNNENDPKDALGFLREINRSNVMLSRAEKLMVLVGSWEFFHFQLQPITPNHPEFEEFQHWKLLLSILADGFDTGWAVKISDTKFIGDRGGVK